MTIRLNIKPGGAFGLYGRIRLDIDGALIQQADVATILWNAFIIPEIATPADSGTLVVADTILNSPAAWNVDSIGYNFRHVLPHTLLTSGGLTCVIEHKIVLASGSELPLEPFEVTTDRRFS